MLEPSVAETFLLQGATKPNHSVEKPLDHSYILRSIMKFDHDIILLTLYNVVKGWQREHCVDGAHALVDVNPPDNAASRTPHSVMVMIKDQFPAQYVGSRSNADPRHRPRGRVLIELATHLRLDREHDPACVPEVVICLPPPVHLILCRIAAIFRTRQPSPFLENVTAVAPTHRPAQARGPDVPHRAARVEILRATKL